MANLRATFAKVNQYQFLLTQLITKNIKLKYRKSYLGVLWSLIEPILTMLVLSFIFGKLLGRGDKYFPIYVLSGRLLYSYYSTCTKQAMRSIRNHASMIKKVYVPKYLYPLSSCISTYVISLISLVDLFLVVLVMRMPLTAHMFLAVIPVLILFMLAYGSSMILATIDVFFRDIEYIWDVFLMLIMYSCAIFYKIESFIGTATYTVLQINPLFCLIQNFRNCIYGKPMDMGMLLYAFGFSAVACLVGTWLCQKKQDQFIFHL